MQTYLKLGHIGLTKTEAMVLKSMVALVQQLSEVYVVVGREKLSEADILLINSDDPKTLALWQKISKIKTHLTPIMLSSQKERIDEAITIKRPLQLQGLTSALLKIEESRTIVSVPDKASQQTNELCVLVIDDSYPVRKYMENKLIDLSVQSIRLSFAASGEEAMKKFKTSQYDLIFLDVVMPGVDGYKVCKTMKSMQKAYVVMLTSKKSPFDKIRGTMSGCNAYITKPPSDSRLLEELELAFDRVQARQPLQ